MARRVVITSVGILSSLGFKPEQVISSLKEGNVAFERSPLDDEVIICPVNNFNIKDFTGRFKYARYLHRGAEFCVAAAIDAANNSRLTENMRAKAGLFVGSGHSIDFGGEFPEIRDSSTDISKLAALWILKYLPNTAAAAISKLVGVHGENATIGTACSASLQAVGEAYRKIKGGYLDLAFAGGGVSRLSYGGLTAYKKANALFTISGDSNKDQYNPFNIVRKGFVPGEGGAFLLLEELEHAKKRRGKIYAEVCGYGASISGHSPTAPDPEGKWEEKSVRSALKEAEISPSQVKVISAHGTGTPLNDDMESELIDRIFGNYKPFVIALKSWIGHLTPACGAMELAICIILMKNNYLPEIRNLIEPCHKSVNFVQKAIDHSFDIVMLENFGFGGQNSTLVVRKWTG